MTPVRHARLKRTHTPVVPRLVHDVLGFPGQPLDAATRAFMEPRFGHDFSQVRVHADAKAAESARAVHARAYAVGPDVIFAAGQYVPATQSGRQLLAHELAHTVQQSRGGSGVGAEQQADAAAANIVGGSSLSLAALGGAPISLQAKPAEAKAARQPASNDIAKVFDGYALNSPALPARHFDPMLRLAREIAARMKADPGASPTIEITGYTDTTGTEGYNQELGMKRADGAKTILLRDLKMAGGSDTSIETHSLGPTHLAKETPAGVGEPLNRRVEIAVSFGGTATVPAAAPPAPTPKPDIPSPDPEYEQPPKMPIDFNYHPPGPGLPDPLPGPRREQQEDPEIRRREWQKGIDAYARAHPQQEGQSLNDWLSDVTVHVLEPAISVLPESLQEKARDAVRAGIERSTEAACDAAIDASGLQGKEADAVKAACHAALKQKPPARR
jgi:hypothetical protein